MVVEEAEHVDPQDYRGRQELVREMSFILQEETVVDVLDVLGDGLNTIAIVVVVMIVIVAKVDVVIGTIFHNVLVQSLILRTALQGEKVVMVQQEEDIITLVHH